MNLLYGPYPAPGRVPVRLHRPTTGRTWTVALARPLPGRPVPVSAKLLKAGIGYVQLPGFFPRAADQVLHAVHGLAGNAKLRGLISDLRGNGGGTPPEVSRLLGAFIHGAACTYDCDVHGNCPATYTDSSVPLLHLPLVVLTDRNSASAYDASSGAVKDLLDDASLPARHELSAHHERINGIGAAPDYHLPLTAQDPSTGHDPDITRALTLLGG